MARARTKKKNPELTAKSADRYELYESSVYDPDADHVFLIETYQNHYNSRPLSLREDFAGTSNLSTIWVQGHRQSKAWAIDIDSEPLNWGEKKHIKDLSPQEKERICQIKDDVLTVSTPEIDVVTAFNFSYWCFKKRGKMLQYFKTVFDSLKEEGMFALDLMGGPSTQTECEEEREEKGFDYIWEQENMCAITHNLKCSIHFHFYDGTKMKNAFQYDWRLWSLTELRDLLIEVGFQTVEAYWEGATKDGEGDGVFTQQDSAENEESWVAYLVAWKS